MRGNYVIIPTNNWNVHSAVSDRNTFLVYEKEKLLNSFVRIVRIGVGVIAYMVLLENRNRIFILISAVTLLYGTFLLFLSEKVKWVVTVLIIPCMLFHYFISMPMEMGTM